MDVIALARLLEKLDVIYKTLRAEATSVQRLDDGAALNIGWRINQSADVCLLAINTILAELSEED